MSIELQAGFSTWKDCNEWHYRNQGWYLVSSVHQGCCGESVMYWSGEKWLTNRQHTWYNPQFFNEMMILSKMVEGVEDEQSYIHY